jgi:DNA-binding GntR family transcriptional regulator
MMEQIAIINESVITKVMQIFNFIVSEIENGQIPFNTQLPSITVFSKKHGVSRDTVEKAYKKLIQEGYDKGIKGKRNFVLDKEINE